MNRPLCHTAFNRPLIVQAPIELVVKFGHSGLSLATPDVSIRFSIKATLSIVPSFRGRSPVFLYDCVCAIIAVQGFLDDSKVNLATIGFLHLYGSDLSACDGVGCIDGVADYFVSPGNVINHVHL
jgi:hypothetical protein